MATYQLTKNGKTIFRGSLIWCVRCIAHPMMTLATALRMGYKINKYE